MKPNPKEINIILNILKGAQFEFLPRAPFYIDTPLPSSLTNALFSIQYKSLLPGQAGTVWEPSKFAGFLFSPVKYIVSLSLLSQPLPLLFLSLSFRIQRLINTRIGHC
jgi:hypothetical protein